MDELEKVEAPTTEKVERPGPIAASFQVRVQLRDQGEKREDVPTVEELEEAVAHGLELDLPAFRGSVSAERLDV